METQMKLASITLPMYGNDGRGLPEVHNALANVLISTFGGVTALGGFGGWKDDRTGKIYREPVTVYYVGIPDEPFAVAQLHQIARMIASAAEQEAIAMTLPNGSFEIIRREGDGGQTVATVQ